jgi:hypothetical protein
MSEPLRCDFRMYAAGSAGWIGIFAFWDSLTSERLAPPHCRCSVGDWDVLLNVDHSCGPTIGRCFAVFHNQVQLGRLEIRASYNYSPQTPYVITEVRLDSVRLLSFDSIIEFLRIIAMHVCDEKAKYEEGESRSNVNEAITTALMEALWQTQEISEFADLDGQDWGELSLHLHGQASRLNCRSYWGSRSPSIRITPRVSS